jgi:hypothetical protein
VVFGFGDFAVLSVLLREHAHPLTKYTRENYVNSCKTADFLLSDNVHAGDLLIANGGS